jgi:hypothetical protein
MDQKRTFEKPVDWDQLYPGRFLKPGELLGKKWTLTIADIELDELEGMAGKKVQGILSFQQTERGLPLNKTNGICLKAMFGKKIREHWIGKKITLFVEKNRVNGEDSIMIWGSPDLDKDLDVLVELSRRKPFTMTMHKTPKKVKDEEQPKESREPGEDG